MCYLLQLRQKPHAKMIGATLVASYSAPSSPKDTHNVKSATLGSAGMKYRLACAIRGSSGPITVQFPNVLFQAVDQGWNGVFSCAGSSEV